MFLLLLATLAAQAQNLEAVLASMDKAAAGFQTAQADFVWDQYQKVVDEHDMQKGVMYFRRQGDDVQMAADITSPPKEKKYVLFTGGKVSVYAPGPGTVTEYNAGKNKADFETFLVLGFGGRGHDLAKSFDVKYAGMEQVQGIKCREAGVDPEIAEGRQHVPDDYAVDRSSARGERATAVHGEGRVDYRLAKYSNIKLNEKLSNDVFKLKTSGKVTYVRPNAQWLERL